MTKLEEFLAGLAVAMVAVGGLGMAIVKFSPDGIDELLPPLTLMVVGHFIFAMVKLKMSKRFKL